MSGLVVPAIIAAGSLAALGVFLHKRTQADRAFAKILTDRGFRPAQEGPGGIDFGVTLQWPQARGITYLNCFTNEDRGTTTTVANVRCWETTGARMSRLGAAMKVDEIRQTVISCRFPGRAIPSFYLCPTDWEGQFRNWTEGGDEIALGDPQFDRTFFLLGPVGADVRMVLTPPVRTLMVSHPNLMLAAGNESVLLFQQAVVLSAQELNGCLDLMATIREEIMKHCA